MSAKLDPIALAKAVQARLQTLWLKNRDGKLTAAEQAEYDALNKLFLPCFK